MVKIRLATEPKEIERFCDIGLTYHLHCNGSMSDWYHFPDRVTAVAIAYDDDVPIGASMMIDHIECDTNFGVAVKPAYQRRGIGTDLVRSIKNTVKTPIVPWAYEEFRVKFFSKALSYTEMFRLAFYIS